MPPVAEITPTAEEAEETAYFHRQDEILDGAPMTIEEAREAYNEEAIAVADLEDFYREQCRAEGCTCYPGFVDLGPADGLATWAILSHDSDCPLYFGLVGEMDPEALDEAVEEAVTVRAEAAEGLREPVGESLWLCAMAMRDFYYEHRYDGTCI